MIRHKKFFIVCLWWLVLGSVGHADESIALKVGYVTDLTGIGTFFGVQSQRGALLAAQEIRNLGGRIKLIIEDSGGRTTDAVTAAEKLLSIEQVDILVCDLTIVCTAISPKVKAAGKILIYNAPAKSIKENNSLALRNFIDYQEACRLVARYWMERGLKFGGLAVNLEFGDACVTGIKEIDPNVFTYQYNPGDDLRSAVINFKSRQLEAVLHVGYEREFLNWFRISAEQSFSPVNGFIEIMLSDTFVKGAGKQINGATVVGYQDLPPAFIANLKREFPSKNDVNIQGAGLAYNAVMSAFDAFASCPDKSTKCLLDRLAIPRSGALLGQRGWNRGISEYPLVLKEWREGKLQADQSTE